MSKAVSKESEGCEEGDAVLRITGEEAEGNRRLIGEQEGKRRVLGRVSNKEIVISMTDKSGKAVVSTPDSYGMAVLKHGEKDDEVADKVLRETEVKVDRHMRDPR